MLERVDESYFATFHASKAVSLSLSLKNVKKYVTIIMILAKIRFYRKKKN